MEVKFADTFLDSIKKLNNRERWYWKVWDFVTYRMPKFFTNIWIFRKALYNFTWFAGDNAILPFIDTAVTEIADKIETRGNEVKSSADKKVSKMRRSSELMKHFINEDFIELAESELGNLVMHDWIFEPAEDESLFKLKDLDTAEEKEHNSKVFKRAREIEHDMWIELWEIFKGQDTSKFTELKELEYDHEKSYSHWDDQYDGSDLRCWWD
jgi:hypothetical protein